MELLENAAPDEVQAQDATLENREATVAPEETACTPAVAEQAEQHRYNTVEDTIAALAELSLKDGAEISRDEVTRIKLAFYAIRKNEVAAEKEAYIAGGGEEAVFVPAANDGEQRFQELLKLIRDKKALHLAQVEEAQREALARKKSIIEELLSLADDTDNINRAFPRFRELTQEFKGTGEVPPTDATEVYRAYTAAVEHFYDQLKINKDLRDYDFKKNLEQKQLMLAEAEALASEEDVIVAFRRLQELHEKWRETGPVAKEIREEIWNSFKDASAAVNKRYQAHFEQRKAAERENEDKKSALCERLEAIDTATLTGNSKWDEATREVLDIQGEWRKLGFASKKANNALFARFREACDKFFAAKADFFKVMREQHTANLAKKIEICERAEALKDSTDWRRTADVLTALQQEWKAIGAVDKKHSDAVWKRFRAACDTFFDRRKQDSSDSRRAEQANLHQKQEIVARLKNVADDTDREHVKALIKEQQALWQSVGHVPFRSKDKVYDEYREAVDALYKKFDLRETGRRRAEFTANVAELAAEGGNKLQRERERIARICEQRKNELKTYENNLGFFSFSSKGAGNLQRDMERRIENLRNDIAELERKIREIDANS